MPSSKDFSSMALKKSSKEIVIKEKALMEVDSRPNFFKIVHHAITNDVLRIPPHFIRYISEDSPNKATLRGLSGGTWSVKLYSDEDGLFLRQGWEAFRKDNQLEDGEFLLFRYDGAMKFTVRVFRKNGLEREVKSRTMDSHQEAPMSDRAKKQKMPAKKPFNSTISRHPMARKSGTEHKSKRVTEQEVETLTAEFPYFVKCLRGYNVMRSFFLYVPKSFFCEEQSKSEKTTIILRNSEGKVWKVNYVPQVLYCTFRGGWKQFVLDNKLKEGDVCLFQLVKSNEMKVTVLNDPPESLMKLVA